MENEIVIKCAYKEMVDVDKLKPHPNNSNEHPREQIEVFKKIILFNGLCRPISVSNLSGFIVAGHGELMACKELGMTKVPVDFQDFDSEIHEKAHMHADNNLARMSVINTVKVQECIVDLDSHNISLEVAGIPQTKAEILAVQPPAYFSEIDENAAAEAMVHQVNKGDENSEWVGMPEFKPGEKYIRLTFIFVDNESREKFVEENNIVVDKKMNDNSWICYK